MDIIHFLLLFFTSRSLATVFDQRAASQFSEEEKSRLIKIYEDLSQKLKSEGFLATKEKLLEHATDLALAVNNDLVSESWIFEYGLECGLSEAEDRSDLLLFLAENCIGTSNIRRFRDTYQKHGQYSFSTSARVIELYELGFIRVEDLLFIPGYVEIPDGVKLLHFALEEGFNVNHVMHFRNGESLSALGVLASRRKYDLVKHLIEAGADVNLPPSHYYRNLWELVTDNSEFLDASLLGLIASLTNNIVTMIISKKYVLLGNQGQFKLGPDGQNTFVYNDDYLNKLQQIPMIDAILRNELEKRFQTGGITVALLSNTKFGFSILDFVALYQPKPLISTLALLREYGVPSHYPLTVTALTEPFEAFRALVESGAANFEEKFFKDTSILKLMLIKGLYEHVKLLALKGPDSLFSSVPNPGILAELLEKITAKVYPPLEDDELLQLLGEREECTRIQFILLNAKSYNLNSKQMEILCECLYVSFYGLQNRA